MSFPFSHKTVFVLDHSVRLRRSCEQVIELDALTKPKGADFIPLLPVSKSLWTCAVEAAVEYCRIVWDIFPEGSLIQFVSSDVHARSLNSWEPATQSCAYLGPPTASREECNILLGIKAALEILSECSDVQIEKRSLISESSVKVLNRGRIICITALKDESQFQKIQDFFNETQINHNKIASGSDMLIPVHQCEVVVIHIFPNNEISLIADKPKITVSNLFAIELISIRAGSFLANKLASLVLRHFLLASTTVTGIPMKEEQNSGSSANYDVELFHPMQVHETILAEEEIEHIRTSKEDAEYETITLKWCTPRTSSNDLYHCTSAYRLTTVDVNSRPSSCLTNFLLSGRAVMLEMPRCSGGKVLSHMLAAYAGEIFIHALVTCRSILEDPPSISEGFGGRVTDYRISDFCDLMRDNMLIPKHSSMEGDLLPLDKAKMKLHRYTLYWPLTLSTTYIFHLKPHLDPLFNALLKDELSDTDLLASKQVLYNLVLLESKNELISLIPAGIRNKSSTKDEILKAIWCELENFIHEHCRSNSHQQLFNCLLELKDKNDEKKNTSFVDKDKKQTEVRDSPLSPDQKSCFDKLGISEQNLLNLWTSRIESCNSKKRVQFIGRIKGATLYANIQKEEETLKD